MSDNLMDTEKGGEQTQYEGVHTFVEPHAKQAGQLGGKLHLTLLPRYQTNLIGPNFLVKKSILSFSAAQTHPQTPPRTSTLPPMNQTCRASPTQRKSAMDRASKRAVREAKRPVQRERQTPEVRSCWILKEDSESGLSSGLVEQYADCE